MPACCRSPPSTAHRRRRPAGRRARRDARLLVGGGRPNDPVTILEGLRAALPRLRDRFRRGRRASRRRRRRHCRGARRLPFGRCRRAVPWRSGRDERGSGEPRQSGPARDASASSPRRCSTVGKPVVALLSSGRPLIAPWLIERADAVVATWFLGSEAGHAIADVVTGRFNPTGRLPVTWPRDIGQTPIFYAARPSGRPPIPGIISPANISTCRSRRSFRSAMAFPTAVSRLQNLRVERRDVQGRATTSRPRSKSSTKDRNAGEATIFLFIRDVVASVARPLLELKGSPGSALAPGKWQTVHLPVPASAFAFPDRDLPPAIEPGRFELSVGLSADRTHLLTTSVEAICG